MSRRVPRRFFEQPTLRVARALLGSVLVRRAAGRITAGRIVEVEAYRGPHDRAAHTWAGRRTRRNESMWGPAGHAYVYFVYGMHHCVNVVTRGTGVPEAVLIRALAPTRGLETMRHRRGDHLPDEALGRGPANLCRAMAIDRSLDGEDLRGSRLWLEPGTPAPSRRVSRGPRIGVAYAGEWALRPWRLWIEGEPAVSGPRSR